ncbi:MAG: hypothetical protein ACREK7_02030 [Gemmatimonadota bacterium]
MHSPFSFRHGAHRVALTGLAVGAVVLAGCGIRERIPGFGPARDGILLIRHSESSPQEIWVNETLLGLAQPGGITCFREVPTGNLRVEARLPGGQASARIEALTRATRLVLPPEQPLLWDVDHDQVFSGRAHARLCGEG